METPWTNAKDMSPGIMRTYGPAVAAGIGTLGLMGGFEPGEVPQSELEETLSGTPGMDLIRGNPNEYLVQNMRGVKYNPDGSFAGYQTPSQSPTTNRGDPYAGFYAPRRRPSFGSRGRPRFAAQGGIMNVRGYAEGGAVRGFAEGGYTSEELGAVADYFATNPTVENIIERANEIGLNAQQVADLYNQAVPSAKDTPMTLDIINNALTTSGKTLDGGYVNYTPEQEAKYNEFLAASPNLTGPEAFQFYDDNNLSLSQAAGLQSQASGDDFYTTKNNYDAFLAANELSLGGGYTGGDLVYPGTNSPVQNPGNNASNAFVTAGTARPTAPAQPADEVGYQQYYGGKNRIAYPRLPSNMDFISASLPYNDYYSGLSLANRGSQLPTRKTVIPKVTPYVPNYSSPTIVTPTKPLVAKPLGANEQLVMDMYAKAGRSGFGDDRGTIDQGGFDYWVDELATGDISADNFRAAFDTARNAQYAAQNLGAPTPLLAARGGIAQLAQNGYPRRTGQISGPGTEKSDSIPAMLSDGEFVMTAKAVRGAGSGSRRAGAKKMYDLMHQLEQNAARG